MQDKSSAARGSMGRRAAVGRLAAAFVGAMALARGSAQTRRSWRLFIDPWRSPALLPAIAARADLASRFVRLYYATCSGGQTLISPAPDGMQTAKFAVSADELKRTLQPWSNAGVECVPFANLFYADNPNKETQELCELDIFLNPPVPRAETFQGKRPVGYLSPFNGQVRARAAAAVAMNGAFQALACHLNPNTVLGYSEDARAAYIRDAGVDPLDLTDDLDEQRAAWTVWREQQMTRLLSELEQKNLPERHGVVAVGTGDLPIRTMEQRTASMDNWLQWLDQGLVQEVLLDCVWVESKTAKIWGALRQIERLSQRNAQATPAAGSPAAARYQPLIGYSQPSGDVVLPARQLDEQETDTASYMKNVSKLIHAAQPTLSEQYANLKAAGAPVENCCFCPNSVEDLDLIAALAKSETGK